MKSDRVLRNARIDKKLDENVVKYCSQNHISYTKAINEGLKLLTKSQMIEDNLPEILDTIERKINDILEPYTKSSKKVMAKCAKSSLSAIFLNGEVYKSIFKEDEEILQELINKADKKAYVVLKNGYLEGDITELFKAKEENDKEE